MEINKKEFIKKKVNIIHKAKLKTTIESMQMSLEVAQRYHYERAVEALNNAIYELERVIFINEAEEEVQEWKKNGIVD